MYMKSSFTVYLSFTISRDLVLGRLAPLTQCGVCLSPLTQMSWSCCSLSATRMGITDLPGDTGQKPGGTQADVEKKNLFFWTVQSWRVVRVCACVRVHERVHGCVWVCTCVQYLEGPEETGVTDGCEPPETGTELPYSGRIVHTCNCRAVSSAHEWHYGGSY